MDRLSAGRRNGFTILEVMIATLLLSIILLVVFSFTIQLRRTEERQRAQTEAQREARSILNIIAADLARATGNSLDFHDPSSGLALLGRTASGAFNTQDLYFETVVFDPNTNQAFRGAGYQYRGRVEGNQWIIEREITERDSNNSGGMDDFEDVNGDRVLNTAAAGNQSVTVLSRQSFNEDFLGDNDGVWSPAEDANADGRPQMGLWFEVKQEDSNNADGLSTIEDLNKNGENDATVKITVDIARRFRGTNALLALATLSTSVQVRNTEPQP